MTAVTLEPWLHEARALLKDFEQEFGAELAEAIGMGTGHAGAQAEGAHEKELALLLALVNECNLLATYMDRDYLFELTLR